MAGCRNPRSSPSSGPTAAGKSDLAVDLALALGGEVVNGDSMQVYRGMDIGTAKLTPDERRGVPHHLLDRLDVTEPATVAEFQGWARAAIDDCRRAASSRSWPAGRRCTCAPCSTTSSSPGPMPAYGRGSRPSWPSSAPPRCTTGSPRSTRPPPR